MLGRDVRFRTAVARVVLITALASVAVPGLVGAWKPSHADPLEPAIFRPVIVRPGAPTAASDVVAGTRSNGSLDVQDVLIEPPDAGSSPIDRLVLDQPDPTALAVVRPTPTPAPTPRPVAAAPAGGGTSSGGGSGGSGGSGDWIYDANVSWYGPGFYGQGTACGLTLTTDLIGVAHRTLPCGTLVTFRNPANGATVTAPVVDRGPYVAGRQWDLTGGLCLALDHCYTGPLYYRFP